MKRDRLILIALLLLSPLAGQAAPDQNSSAIGESLWRKIVIHQQSGQERSCTTCHTDDLKQAGKHAKTGKPIDPMAPSVNPQRLTDPQKIAKWFKRNCKWTFNRECTEPEKEAFLSYIRAQ